MLQHTDLSSHRQGVRRSPGRYLRAPAARLALTVLVVIVGAMPVSGVPFDADPEAAAALLEGLGERYEILTLSDRYVLQPTDPEASFRSIEIKAGEVAVDGEAVTQTQLRDLVGDAAETAFAIAELGSEETSETSVAEERRRRIELLAEERRLKAEEIEEMVRSRVEELESLEEEHLEAIEEAIDEPRRRGRRGRRGRCGRPGETQSAANRAARVGPAQARHPANPTM